MPRYGVMTEVEKGLCFADAVSKLVVLEAVLYFLHCKKMWRKEQFRRSACCIENRIKAVTGLYVAVDGASCKVSLQF
jgi:hypothetical protein